MCVSGSEIPTRKNITGFLAHSMLKPLTKRAN